MNAPLPAGRRKAATMSAPQRREALIAAVRKHIAAKAYDRADARLRKHLAADPDCAEALFALAAIRVARMDLAEAHTLLQRVSDRAPMVRQPADLLAVVLGLAGQLNAAVYHAKASVSLTPDPAFDGLLPPGLPGFASVLQFVSEQPLLNRALIALGHGDTGRAEYWCRQHLAFEPKSEPAWMALASALRASGRHRAALDALRAARHALPEAAGIVSLLAQALASVGDHEAARVAHHLAVSRAPEDVHAAAAELVDGWSRPSAAVPSTVAAVKDWSRRFGARARAWTAAPAAAPARGERLTLGVFLGADAHRAWAPFLADILAARRTDRFAAIGFGNGPLDRGANLPFQRSFDRWRDVSEIDAITLQSVIAAERVDILLNVAGFAAPEALTALGARLAPCQIVWTGSPFGTGLAAVDFVLTDRFVCDRPDAVADEPLFLDQGCVLTAPPVPAAGSEAGGFGRDPEAGIVFAADADLAAIEPVAVAAWAAVLERVPGSSLVLRDQDLTEPANLAAVTDLFGNHGLSHRVDILKGDRLELLDAADVVLMPFGRAEPQVVVDGLAAGRPVVCPAGDGPFARRAAAVLHHLGLGAESIAVDAEDYLAKSLSWAAATLAEDHRAWRADVMASLRRARFFDARTRAADLGTALETAWSRTGALAGTGNAGHAA